MLSNISQGLSQSAQWSTDVPQHLSAAMRAAAVQPHQRRINAVDACAGHHTDDTLRATLPMRHPSDGDAPLTFAQAPPGKTRYAEA